MDGYRPLWEVGTQPGKSRARGRRKKITDRRHDWTEAQVFEKLEPVFPSPAHVRLPGVRNDTGKTAGSRSIDGLVGSLYPSRGLWLAGVEIKITKSDWRKELREPEKSEALMRFCKYWYMACPSGVIPHGEVPELWGIIEVRKDGATIVRPAQPLDCEPPTLDFVLSIMRKVNEQTEPRAVEKRSDLRATPAEGADAEGEPDD